MAVFSAVFMNSSSLPTWMTLSGWVFHNPQQISFKLMTEVLSWRSGNSWQLQSCAAKANGTVFNFWLCIATLLINKMIKNCYVYILSLIQCTGGITQNMCTTPNDKNITLQTKPLLHYTLQATQTQIWTSKDNTITQNIYLFLKYLTINVFLTCH